MRRATRGAATMAGAAARRSPCSASGSMRCSTTGSIGSVEEVLSGSGPTPRQRSAGPRGHARRHRLRARAPADRRGHLDGHRGGPVTAKAAKPKKASKAERERAARSSRRRLERRRSRAARRRRHDEAGAAYLLRAVFPPLDLAVRTTGDATQIRHLIEVADVLAEKLKRRYSSG